MDKKLNVWHPVGIKESEFYLVYGMNKEGIKGWYVFDTQEETIQRFAEDLYEKNQNEEVVTAFQQNSNHLRRTTDTADTAENGRVAQIISLIVTLVVITVLTSILYIRKKQYS